MRFRSSKFEAMAAMPAGAEDIVAASGESITFRGKRDGDYRDWCARQNEKHRFAAEAQAAWEEKARADAEAWARREEG